MGRYQTIVTVYNSEGEAVEGALVDITNADHGGKTNCEGEYEFIAASKEITYQVKATRYSAMHMEK